MTSILAVAQSSGADNAMAFLSGLALLASIASLLYAHGANTRADTANAHADRANREADAANEIAKRGLDETRLTRRQRVVDEVAAVSADVERALVQSHRDMRAFITEVASNSSTRGIDAGKRLESDVDSWRRLIDEARMHRERLIFQGGPNNLAQLAEKLILVAVGEIFEEREQALRDLASSQGGGTAHQYVGGLQIPAEVTDVKNELLQASMIYLDSDPPEGREDRQTC